ncbi:MAG: hypothetical protein NC903_01790, partial [Candidatus Omnitrophica bacterium]|nr:hypothetical protein [Candidatus Omnitrophota bacterium]
MIDKTTLNLFKKIIRITSKRDIKIYLVGGYLRDLILKNKKRKDLDIDFCLKRGAINLGKRIASELKAGFVILDKKHSCCRVVKKTKTKTYTLDFTDFRGRDLKADLFKRDFTINAFAIDLEDFLKKGKDFEESIVDPYGGREDLKKETVRLINERGFLEDPLRILRAFSIAGLLDFKIDKKTIFLIKRYSHLIAKVSGERIREELFKILDLDYSYNYLKKMDEEKVLEVIFPQVK